MSKSPMSLDEFRAAMSQKEYVALGSDLYGMFHYLSQEALKITNKINNSYNSPDKLRKLFSELIGKEVDETFGLFPPFYTDCGKNITVGKNVFINACCRFQDQGGITIGDGCFIGHNTTIATLNHDFNPKTRANITPAPVKLGKNVWIGADCTILPNVEIGDGSIIGAGSVVTKSVPPNSIAVGNPARVIKEIEVNYE